VNVCTNHKNLKYFMSPYVLKHCQALWNIALFCFDFTITYEPERQEGLSDALSWRSYLVSKKEEAPYNQQQTILFKSEQLWLCEQQQ